MSKPKPVNVQFIAPEEKPSLYAMMRELITKYHKHLEAAKIALFWRYGWKGDADDRLVLGQASKASDVDRELHDYDFVIQLNHEVCNSGEWSDRQTEALLDHELSHCEAKRDDKTGQFVFDDKNRVVWRMRKHDIEEFRDIVTRHGLYKADLEAFAESIREAAEKPLLKHLG
ncbi:MAG: hypothetical protein IT450_05025 [Phycisphaerales bacterium]|nr:hypothetical protein [Phycisphaerales bacterium]